MAVVKTPSGRWRGKVKQGRLTLKTKTFNTRREAAAWVERQKAILDGGKVAADLQNLLHEEDGALL